MKTKAKAALISAAAIVGVAGGIWFSWCSGINYERRYKKLFDKITVANELAAFFADKDVPKTIVYRYITHVYQTVFYEPQPKDTERQLLRAVDWTGYHRVSRTKLRHRVLYAALRISPSLFRIINNRLSR